MAVANPLLPPAAATEVDRLRARHFDFLEAAISGKLMGDGPAAAWFTGRYIERQREFGGDWPSQALSMIGNRRLRNLRQCLEYVVRHGIAGDFIETGVWRGGACIYAKAILDAYDVTDRTVWVADSFEGLPPPNLALYPQDSKDLNYKFKELAISLETVTEHFTRFGVLDDRVRFLKGWFSETLPSAPIERIAVLRLDGDMYESTMDALTNLYPKLVPGGFCIIDDYHLANCRQAVMDYRAAHAITDTLVEIDGSGMFWQRSSQGETAPLSRWMDAQDEAHSAVKTLRAAGRVAEAHALACEASRDYPTNYDLACLAATLCLSAGDLGTAESFARRAADLRLWRPMSFDILGDILYNQQKYEELLRICSELGDFLKANMLPYHSLHSVMSWHIARVSYVLGLVASSTELAKRAEDEALKAIARGEDIPWLGDLRILLARLDVQVMG